MRIFYSFLIMVTTVILWLVPFSAAIYDFRTDVREDNFTITTDPEETTASVVLLKELYDDDTETITVLSSIETDTPALSTYTSATRTLLITGLDDDTNRVLNVTYSIAAFPVGSALDTIMGITPFIIYLLLIAFPVVGLIAIWKFNRA